MRALILSPLLFAALILSPTTALSVTSDTLDDLIFDAGRIDLASNPQWLRLVHYERSRWFGAGLSSAVLNDTFFLAEDGSTDPRA